MTRAWHALAAYVVITFAATWPLGRNLSSNVPWDLGDPLLNMWVLAWDCEQLLAILRGDFSRIAAFYDANIFYPAPLTLAYAEHLFAQAVQVLPVYAATKNPILCYNLLFLSTFILSGLGMYLLVRELTDSAWGAFAAGLLFAFAPYRMPQGGHLQILSSQWMPFALYGLTRYFSAVARGARHDRALAGGSLALVAQNLSCGYYLLYFMPVAAAYGFWEMLRRRLARQRRVWISLSIALALVVIVTTPFFLPYGLLRSQFGFARTEAEVKKFSADVYSYATAGPGLPLWGSVLREYPKPEGDLFPGLVPLVLAAIGLAAWRAPRSTTGQAPRFAATRPWLAPALSVLAAFHVIVAGITLLSRRINTSVAGIDIQITDINQLLLRALLFTALLLWVSPATRARFRSFLLERGFFVVVLVAAVWLSLGIAVEVRGRSAELVAPYAWLFEHAPGFQGVRVPARFAMIVALMLAVLGGYGAAVVASLTRGPLIVAGLSFAFLAESLVVPMPLNGTRSLENYRAPEARVYRPARAPAIYTHVKRLPQDAVLVELPLGTIEFDVRAMYYSTAHWRRLVNGYSGFVPPSYEKLVVTLGDIPRFPDLALKTLREHGATHALVHEGAYLAPDNGTTRALMAAGAREIAREGTDVLLELP